MASLVNDLDALAGSTVVVLDDYHVIESTEVHQAVAFLLEHLPPQVTLAMTTRADPPLPLSRLRARGELLEIRAADLRFTAEEADVFLNQVMGLQLEPRPGGGPGSPNRGLGRRPAARGPLGPRPRDQQHRRAGIRRSRGVRRGVHRQPSVRPGLPARGGPGHPARGRALPSCSTRRSSSSSPGACATRSPVAATANRCSRSLERDNLFLVPLDDQRQWFRYHHLFADALRARLQAENPGRVPSLHRAASDWHAEHGTLADAIRHALAAGDIEQAADLRGTRACQMPDSGERTGHCGGG